MLALAGLASVAAFGNGPAAANMDLAKAKNCTACHAVDRKLIGPAYQDVARKYANDKDAAARLTKKVIAGGVGVWGQVPMPPNPQATPDEAAALVRWVLSLK
jgi:cytochrome c